MPERSQLIDSLATAMRPLRPVRGLDWHALGWCVLALGLVAVAALAGGTLRAGVLEQLQDHPRFLLESLLGATGIVMAGVAAFRAAVPGALSRRFGVATVLVLAAWTLCYVIGLYSPALEPSMLGKRPGCVWETPLLALAPLLLALGYQRRLYPLHPAGAGALLGLAAGSLAALFMQFACMYEPRHILGFHLLPGIAVAPAGALLALLAARSTRRS